MRLAYPLFVCLMACLPAFCEELTITADDAVRLAMRQNLGLSILTAKSAEQRFRANVAASGYFPQTTTSADLWRLVNQQKVQLPAGALGTSSDGGLLPASPVQIEQGGQNLFFTNTTVAQPLTQLIGIRHAHKAAQAEARTAEAEAAKARQDVALGVRQLFAAVLANQGQREAAACRLDAAREQLKQAEDAVASGSALSASAIAAAAAVEEALQATDALHRQSVDLLADLKEIIGVPLDVTLSLRDTPLAEVDTAVERDFHTILMRSPDVEIAGQQVEKARRALGGARAEYVPGISVFAQYTYQNGVPFLAKNNGVAGVKLEWKVFDFGKRANQVKAAQQAVIQAETSLERTRRRLAVDLAKALNKVASAQRLIDVCAKDVAARREAERVAADQEEAGTASRAQRLQVRAARAKAEADALQARLGYTLALAEYRRLTAEPL